MFNQDASHAHTTQKGMNIYVEKTDNYKKVYLILTTLFIHEYTHILRIRENLFRYRGNNYYLNPEEMIAFHNQLSVESCILKKDFNIIVSKYARQNIPNEKIRTRFYNGIIRLHKKGNLWYNTKKEFVMNKEIEDSIKRFDEDMVIWRESLGKQVCLLPEDKKQEALLEFYKTVEDMRNSILKQLEEYSKRKNQ